MAVTVQGDMIISTNSREDKEAFKAACAEAMKPKEVEAVPEVVEAPVKKTTAKAKAEDKE